MPKISVILPAAGRSSRFKDKEKKFPFFVIFPQAATGGSWKASAPPVPPEDPPDDEPLQPL